MNYLEFSKVKMLSCSICPVKVTTLSNLEAHKISHMRDKINCSKLLSKLFSCSLCTYATNNSSHLRRHKENHPNCYVFACNSCSYTSKYSLVLERHQERMHPTSSKKFSCKNCPFETNFFQSLKRHRLSKHSKMKKKFSCDSCSSKFKWPYELKRHQSTVHSTSTKMFSCKICPFETKYFESLKKHKSTVHSTSAKKFSCKICPFKTNYIKNVKRHQLAKHSKMRKKFSCDSCSSKFKWPYELKRHQSTVHSTSTKIFSCKNCSFETSYFESLKRHRLTKHSKMKKQLSCNSCSYKCRLPDALKRHQSAMHSKMFFCEYCSFKSKFEVSVKRHSKNKHSSNSDSEATCYKTDDKSHLQIHLLPSNNSSSKTLTKRFECEFCQYIGARADVLEIHKQRAHPDKVQIQGFKCDLCKYVGNRVDLLDRHKRRCHPDQTLMQFVKCDLCEYVGSRLNLLERHKQKCHFYEGGLKKLKCKCKYCEYVGTSRDLLLEHLQRLHPTETSIPCKFCDYIGTRDDLLDRHRRRNHPDTNNNTVDVKVFCKYVETESENLKKHVKINHPRDTRKFQCESCDYVAKQSSDLKKHCLRKHKDQKAPIITSVKSADSDPSKQTVCTKTAKSRLSCKFCSYKAKKSSVVLRHQRRMHSDIFQFQCEKCSYKTNDFSNFKRHARNRHGEETYNKVVMQAANEISEVDTSIMKFKKSRSIKLQKSVSGVVSNHKMSSALLKKYSRINNIETFVCGLCPFKSKYRSNMRRHQKSFHMIHSDNGQGEETNQGLIKQEDCFEEVNDATMERMACEFCSFKSRYKNNLKRHQITFHGTYVEYDRGGMKSGTGKMKQEDLDVKPSTSTMLTLMKPDNETEGIENSPCKIKIEVCNTDNGRRDKLTGKFCTNKSKYKKSLTSRAENRLRLKPKQLFKCQFCSFQSLFKRRLETHENKYHPNPKQPLRRPGRSEKYRCKYCSFNSKYKSNLKIHQKKFHSMGKKVGKLLFCQLCPFQTKYIYSLEKHITWKRCPGLKSNNEQKNNTNQPENENSSLKKFTCPSCPFKSKYLMVILHHKKLCQVFKLQNSIGNSTNVLDAIKVESPPTQNQQKSFLCNVCPFKSKYKKSLQRHIRLKRCPALKSGGKSTVTSYILKSKNFNINKSSSGTYLCNSCPFQSKYKSSLYKHINFQRCPATKSKVKMPLKIKIKAPRTRNDKTTSIIFRCQLCPFKSVYRSSFMKHRQHLHSSIIKNEVGIETAQTKHIKEESLSAEVTHVNTLQLFECQFCSIKYKYRRSLHSHQKKHHQNNFKDFQQSTYLPQGNNEQSSFENICNNKVVVKIEKLELPVTNAQPFNEESPQITDIPKFSNQSGLEKEVYIKQNDSLCLPVSKIDYIQKSENKKSELYHKKEVLAQKDVQPKSNLKCSDETLVRQEIKETIKKVAAEISNVTTDAKEKVLVDNQCKFCLVKCANPNALIMHLKRHIFLWEKKIV